MAAGKGASDELLESLRADRERAMREVERIDGFIAGLEKKGQDDDGKLTLPLTSFLKEEYNWDWLFRGLIPTGATCILAGEGKLSAKSTLLIQMSLCLAAGRAPFYECPVPRAARTLYVATEGARGALQQRIRTAARSLGLEPGIISDLWHIQKRTSSDYMLGSRSLEKMIDESAAALVVLDTVKYCHRGNNNDATDWVRHVMEPARKLTAKYGCTFVFVDHQSKPSAERKGMHKIGGTISKKDDCDVIMQLEADEQDPQFLTDKRVLWLSGSKYSKTRRWDLRVDLENAKFG